MPALDRGQPIQVQRFRPLQRHGVLDQTLNRREAAIASQQQQRPSRFGLQHELAYRAIHAHGLTATQATKYVPGESIARNIADMELQIAVVARTTGDGVIAGIVADTERHALPGQKPQPIGARRL